MGCNCNKSKCKCAKGSVCDPSFTGDISFDGADNTCQNEPLLDTPSGTNLNVILANIWAVLCALTGIGMSNVGTGAGIFRDQIGYIFNLRSLVGGPGVTITEGTDEILIEVDAGGSGTHVTVFCASDRLGDGAGGLILPGTTMPATTYVVPVSGAGQYEVYYSVDAVIPAGEEAQLRLDVNGLEFDPNAKRIMQSGGGTNRLNAMLLVCGINLNDGDTIDIKGYKSDGTVVFNNGVCIVKKVS